jgi:membrane-associated HD superfamily phosphohydrolase
MGQSFSFVLYALVGSLAGIFGIGRLRSRSVLLAMGGIVAAANLVSITVITLLTGGFVAGDFFVEAAAALAGGWFVAMLIGAALPLFEHFFHVTTDIRLLELSNQNLPLLRNLALEAPGTYQHSLMLGHLAEAAAEAIVEPMRPGALPPLLPRHRQDPDARLLHREPAQRLQPP